MNFDKKCSTCEDEDTNSHSKMAFWAHFWLQILFCEIRLRHYYVENPSIMQKSLKSYGEKYDIIWSRLTRFWKTKAIRKGPLV